MSDLEDAVRYLQQSKTALTRRRGRNAVRSALAALLKAYPPIGKDGLAKPAAKKPRCPLCGVPTASWTALAGHLRAKHCGNSDKLVCPGCKERFRRPASLSAHLSALQRLGKLQDHVVGAATQHAFSS